MASLWLRLLGFATLGPESGLRRRWEKKKVPYEKDSMNLCILYTQRRWKERRTNKITGAIWLINGEDVPGVRNA